MRKIVKSSFALLLGFVLLLSVALSPVSASAKTGQIDYVALGDSLAAGQSPYKTIGKGYTDMIAAQLEKQNKLSSFTKQFSVSGYTTQQVLDIIQKPETQNALKEAELVTLSAGANDLLQLLNQLDPNGNYDMNLILQTVQKAQQNIKTIVKQVQTLNPKAKVYVMGYYFPFPHAPESPDKTQLREMTSMFNQVISDAAKVQGAIFVPVADQFVKKEKEYLPNPSDVHPNEAGYQVMADAFFTYYQEDTKKPKKFKDLPDNYWAQEQIEYLTNAGVINGRSDGTFQPGRLITRAEAAIILAKIVPGTSAQPENPGFKDVPATHPAYLPIAQLTELGVFSKAKHFNPYQPLSRAQLAKIIAESFDIEADGTVAFKDVSQKYWGKPYIEAVATNNIMNGFKPNSFKPNQNTTRAEVAATIVRTLEVKGIELPVR
ncbi:MAG TPA: S-layer homology domain-containing protein [Chondromyces sp.]|nr:S-layer homology domain-containing protein [Chondromyces sp.]